MKGAFEEKMMLVPLLKTERLPVVAKIESVSQPPFDYMYLPSPTPPTSLQLHSILSFHYPISKIFFSFSLKFSISFSFLKASLSIATLHLSP